MAINRARGLQVYDPVLSNLARSYRPKGFIARDLLPAISVTTLSGQYPIFTKSFWFQQAIDNEVVDRTPAKEVDFEWSTDTYLAKEYALKVGISDLERQQAIPQLQLEKNKTDFLTGQMELAYEVRVANALRAGNDGGKLSATNSTSISTGWDSTGNPEADIKAASLQMYTLIGRRPNTIVIPFPVAYAMALNSTFRTILRYDATGKPRDFIELGEQVIPATIAGMRVIVPDGAQIDSGREGGTSSISEIWGKDVRLLYCDTGAQWGEPSVMYRMEHTPKRVTKWSQVDPDVDYVREMERFDLKAVAPDAGWVLKGAIS